MGLPFDDDIDYDKIVLPYSLPFKTPSVCNEQPKISRGTNSANFLATGSFQCKMLGMRQTLA